ncbi:MAG: N-acetyl-gamma-glutamyl-phosphate reductase, partial [Muribaculaceae bacterium]|nr:N-acetyl-gamma-glutamyl-phosphate reductase [Muribaculaceae bacterium]
VSMRGPQSRGTMVSLLLDAATDLQHLRELYDNFYDDHNFVYLTDRPVELKDVVNTNKCLIHLQKFDGRLLISAAIDNLLKGGAGTAVHCMNLLFGLAERTGLTLKTSSYF